MSLEVWLKNRVGWLLAPGLISNLLVVGLAAPWAASVEAFTNDSLQLFLLVTVGLTLALHAGLSSWSLSRARVFRGLVDGRLTLDAANRLAALSELRAFPGLMARLSIAGWFLGSLILALLMVFAGGAPWTVLPRVTLMGLIFGSLATLLLSLLTSARAHEAHDRLSEGLPPHAVIGGAAAAMWTLRGRAVAFTLVVTVVPLIIGADLGAFSFAEAVRQIARAPLDERHALATVFFEGIALRLVILGLCSAAFAALVGSAAGIAVARPMQLLAIEAQRVARGDLSVPRVIAADGEVWRVTGVFGLLHERLAVLVGKVLSAGTQMSEANVSLQRTSSRSEATVSEQAASLNETSATTEELARSARQIAASASAVQELAQRTLTAAEQGRQDAAAFQASVDRMRQDNRSIANAVERLQRRVQQIGRIVELINTVADRSDLLALSAELEGTRAGEVGRGFSLVGAEMRRLAENVLESTAEVEELISEIRDATVKTAEATEHGSQLTERGTALADSVTASLSEVARLALETSNEVRTITLSTQQQQSGTDQLAEVMSEILVSTQSGLDTTHRLTQVNQRLLGLSTSLQTLVQRFIRVRS